MQIPRLWPGSAYIAPRLDVALGDLDARDAWFAGRCSGEKRVKGISLTGGYICRHFSAYGSVYYLSFYVSNSTFTCTQAWVAAKY